MITPLSLDSLPVIIPMMLVSGCLAFAFLGARSNGGLVFAILYGLFSGGFVSVSAPVSASFSRNVGENPHWIDDFRGELWLVDEEPDLRSDIASSSIHLDTAYCL
ncbi:hypothetical protein FB451DRAFT_1393075 [Mycena latifolia]|nr:hypothetical protein FB451DRAFT_1393075 [Mycena latifolia]